MDMVVVRERKKGSALVDFQGRKDSLHIKWEHGERVLCICDACCCLRHVMS
jgi:hypothetical protein